ncbi:MAG: RidA family protein, partial [Pseudomonadota bacterium]
DNVEALLKASRMSVADIMRVTYFLTDSADLPALSEIRTARWGSDAPPAVTTLVVAALAKPGLVVEIEVTAAKA